MEHNKNIRVYYEDTDAGGIVYHANYLNYAERARTEFLRFVGFENSILHEVEGVIFVVRHIDIDYLKTAHLDDSLQVKSSLIEIKNSSFIMRQTTFNGDVMITDMKVVIVCVDTKNYKPVRLPENIKDAFKRFKEDIK